MASKLHKVFVYGTLKKGEPNHGWFTKSQNGYHKFLCKAATVTKFPLIIATKYNIPFLLHMPGVGNEVEGEVYEVNDEVFADLDQLEEYPKWYTREMQPVRAMYEDISAVKQEQHIAWIYFIQNFRPELLTKQMFRSYSTSGVYGLQYCDSELNAEDEAHTIYSVKLQD